MDNLKTLRRISLALIFCSIALLCVCCSDSDIVNTTEANTCVEPENPYNEDTGHYAGYSWAQENSEACDGSSESFNEGCNEYYAQLDAYEACQKK
jgi:hypothetical protein